MQINNFVFVPLLPSSYPLCVLCYCSNHQNCHRDLRPLRIHVTSNQRSNIFLFVIFTTPFIVVVSSAKKAKQQLFNHQNYSCLANRRPLRHAFATCMCVCDCICLYIYNICTCMYMGLCRLPAILHTRCDALN